MQVIIGSQTFDLPIEIALQFGNNYEEDRSIIKGKMISHEPEQPLGDIGDAPFK